MTSLIAAETGWTSNHDDSRHHCRAGMVAGSCCYGCYGLSSYHLPVHGDSIHIGIQHINLIAIVVALLAGMMLGAFAVGAHMAMTHAICLSMMAVSTSTCNKPTAWQSTFSLGAGMMLGAFAVGAHMAMTHAICLSMMAAYIPATEVPGLGRVSGTVWSFTDFVLGKLLQ